MKKLLILSLACASTTVLAEKISGPNSPFNFNKITGTSMVTTLSDLPPNGRLNDDRLGWSETYWPANIGGIAYRWNSPNPQPFKYKLHSLDELKSMNENQISELSPAELYDISQGDYNYTLTRKILSLNSPRDSWWEGICHGWSPAAINYPEPAPITIVNKDGLRVPFGSSDVKGLLSAYQAYNYNRSLYAAVGGRCKVPGKVPGEGDSRDPNTNPPTEEESNLPECRDMNAGSFHIIITNMIGIHSQGFVADIDRYNDVWNQPIIGYTSQIVGEEPTGGDDTMNGIAKRVRVKLSMSYGEELKFWTAEYAAQGLQNFVSKLPVTGTVHEKILTRDYEYILELDAAGNIVGGEWVTATRPDFVWTIGHEQNFRDGELPLSGLKAIYRPVRR